jgi:hypothetical protein
MGLQDAGDFAQEQLVAGVQLQVVGQLHPLEVLGIVPGFQVELTDLETGD